MDTMVALLRNPDASYDACLVLLFAAPGIVSLKSAYTKFNSVAFQPLLCFQMTLCLRLQLLSATPAVLYVCQLLACCDPLHCMVIMSDSERYCL